MIYLGELGIPDSILESWFSNYIKAKESGEPVTYETTYIRDNEIQCFSSVAIHLKADKFLFLSQDISSRKKLEEELKYNKDILEKTVKYTNFLYK